jgi:hypothetical protein
MVSVGVGFFDEPLNEIAPDTENAGAIPHWKQQVQCKCFDIFAPFPSKTDFYTQFPSNPLCYFG